MSSWLHRLRLLLGRPLESARGALCWLVDLCALASVLPGPHGARILVVRLDGIGDFILWLGFARQLRHAYPGHHMVLAANRSWADWAEELKLFDEVIAVDQVRFMTAPLYRLGVQRHIRRIGFESAINPTFSRSAWLDDSVMRVSGAISRTGSQGDLSNTGRRVRRMANRWYTELVPAMAESQMELRRNAEFLRGLGLADARAEVACLRGEASPTTSQGAVDYILVPGAGWSGRQWPATSFAELASRLFETRGWRGALCGSAAERPLAEAIAAMTPAPLAILSGKTSYAELTRLVAAARIVIGNDTSTIHLAATLDIPAVCVLGGGHYGRFHPYDGDDSGWRIYPRVVVQRMDCFGCNWKCPYPRERLAPVPCVAAIGVEQVWNEVAAALR